MEERLQKLIAQAGLASRRKAEEWIEQGRVTLNGNVATLGDKADLSKDSVFVDGSPLPRKERYRYIMMYKQRGVLSAVQRQNQLDRPTVLEMIEIDERVYPVGRLDLNSEGLILLTNDGELTNRITHPRYGHEKTYKVLVDGIMSEEKLEQWRHGMLLPDGFKTSPCHVKVLESSRQGTWVRVVMGEGHKRQIRTICDLLGNRVQRLIRTHIGGLEIGELLPGQWRELTSEEVEALKSGAPMANDYTPNRPLRVSSSRPRPNRSAAKAGSRRDNRGAASKEKKRDFTPRRRKPKPKE